MAGRAGNSRPLIVALGCAAGVLALVNWHLAQTRIDVSPIVPEAGKIDGPQKGNSALTTALDKKPAALFRETVSRPLFTPDRKPVQRMSAASEPAAITGELRLVGVIKQDHQPARALIRSSNEASGKWVVEGEQFGGWKLRQVMERSVIVEAGGRSQELTLQAPARRQPDDPAAAPTGEPRSR